MPAGGPPAPDYTDIRPTDTRLSWLQRTDVYKFWQAHPDTGEPVGTTSENDDLVDGFVFCLISEPEFHAIATDRGPGAPLWPGLAGVTLGEPVVLTESGFVEGPMDGVLVTIDAVAPGTGAWVVGGRHDWYRAGYLMFESTEGHGDALQYLGQTQAVYCPLSMRQAGGVLVRLNAASQVTVTPWLLA